MPNSKMRIARRVREEEPPTYATFPPPDHEKFKSFMYKVKDGDSFVTLAKEYGALDAWDLIYHNFRMFIPERVNWYLHRYVGCNYTTDEWNYCFSSADKPGEISIPRYDLLRQRPEPEAPENGLLRQRWYELQGDIERGREILLRLLMQVHLEAMSVAGLPEMPELCQPSLLPTPWPSPSIIPAPWFPWWTDLVVLTGCSLVNVAIANQSRKVSRIRVRLYWAFAEGVASNLDPSYLRHRRFENGRQKQFFLLGQRLAIELDPIQQHQLSVALVENYRSFGMSGFRPYFQQTLKDFSQELVGAIFSLQIRNELSLNPFAVD
jgi:hypothetical protein